MPRVFLIAGELSGDRLGAALIAGLRELAPDGLQLAGVGGPLMAEQGLARLFPMQELSVMGVAEVLRAYPRLRRRLLQTAQVAADWAPDVVVGIDSPDFCLRVAARLRRLRPRQRIVHYVAPSVWAWRPGRAARMARHVDQVLCLLPFEPPLMQAAGMRADFTGHPLVAEPVATAAEVAAWRAASGLGGAPVLLVLPGSRRAEVARLLPVFGAALREVLAARPDLRLVLPTVAPVAEAVVEGVRDWPGAPLVLDPRGQAPELALAAKRAAFAAAGGTGEARGPGAGAPGAALAASGTVSLELAANAVPMVVAYDMAWLSWQVMSRLARIDTVTLLNLISGRKVVPEFLGPACRPPAIAAALLTLLDQPAQRQAQVAAANEAMRALGRGGPPPGLRAARAVLEGLQDARAAAPFLPPARA